MNIAKFIRVLGYIVFQIFWLPITVLQYTVGPIVAIGLTVKNGKSVKRCWKQITRTLAEDIAHAIAFIRNGEW